VTVGQELENPTVIEIVRDDLMKVLSKSPYLLRGALSDEFRKSQGNDRHTVFNAYDDFLLGKDKGYTTNNEDCT
jgi:hypothetical protein